MQTPWSFSGPPAEYMLFHEGDSDGEEGRLITPKYCF